MPSLGQRNLGVLGDDVLAEGGQCHRDLDRRARLRACGQGQLLVHHRQDTAVVGIHRDDRTVHPAQGLNRSCANHWIFTRRDIALDLVIGERTGVKALAIIVMFLAGDGMGGRFRWATVALL